MRKRLVLLQALAILIAVFQYGMRAAGQEEEGYSNSVLSNVFHPYVTGRIPLAGSVVDEWMAATGRVNDARIRAHRQRIHQRYRGMPPWKIFTWILIGILCTYGNMTARTVWYCCTSVVYLYQLTVKPVLFCTLREWCALVNEMLLMMAGDVESNPGPAPEPVLKELVEVKVKSWYNLGLELDIHDDDLQTIERNHPQDQDDCKRDMFRTWLRNCPKASYRQLVQALVELGDVSEAERLCKKFGQLVLEDLSEVMLALYEAHSKWYDIGIELELSVGTLDTIREDFPHPAHCLKEMCVLWLKRFDPHPSWEALAKALESPSVGEGHLAQQLRDKYCRGTEETITHIYPAPGPSSLTGVPPTSQGSSSL